MARTLVRGDFIESTTPLSAWIMLDMLDLSLLQPFHSWVTGLHEKGNSQVALDPTSCDQGSTNMPCLARQHLFMIASALLILELCGLPQKAYEAIA